MTRSENRPPVPRAVLIFGCVYALLTLWSLAIPPTAGPDEVEHQIQAGAMIRGQVDLFGNAADGSSDGYLVPERLGWPPPSCFVFAHEQPVDCSFQFGDPPDADHLATTRAEGYPIWGYLLPSLGTLAPLPFTPYVTRAAAAILPAALVSAGLVTLARRSWLGLCAAICALTSSAWILMSVTSPAGLTIAGGFGFWVACLTVSEDLQKGAQVDSAVLWLARFSWPALLLARRDGLVWAMLLVALVIVFLDIELSKWWSLLDRGTVLLSIGSTVLALAWATGSDRIDPQVLLATPALPIGAVLVRWWWENRTRPKTPDVQSGGTSPLKLIALVVSVLAAVAFVNLLTQELDLTLILDAAVQTPAHLHNAIGDRALSSTPLPWAAFVGWLACMVMLISVADPEMRWRNGVAAISILGASAAVSWVAIVAEGNPGGIFFVGRYYLPVLIGIPLILSRAGRTSGPLTGRRVRVCRTVLALGLATQFVVFAASLRRFAVGTTGSGNPLNWDELALPVPAVVLLTGFILLLGLLSMLLASTADSASTISPSRIQQT